MASGSGISGKEKDWKDGKEWLLLLLSLLLAFIIWLLHSLSLEYSVFFEYNVQLTSSLEGRSRSSVSEDVLIVRGRSEGYYILRQRIGRRKTVRVTAPATVFVQKKDDVFSVGCESIKSNVVEALGGNVNLEFIVTDSLDFVFPRITSKKVPVALRSSISFRGQYMPLGRIELRPDSVDIYGDARLLETVDSVMTETIFAHRSGRPHSGYVLACSCAQAGLFRGQHILLHECRPLHRRVNGSTREALRSSGRKRLDRIAFNSETDIQTGIQQYAVLPRRL